MVYSRDNILTNMETLLRGILENPSQQTGSVSSSTVSSSSYSLVSGSGVTPILEANPSRKKIIVTGTDKETFIKLSSSPTSLAFDFYVNKEDTAVIENWTGALWCVSKGADSKIHITEIL